MKLKLTQVYLDCVFVLDCDDLVVQLWNMHCNLQEVVFDQANCVEVLPSQLTRYSFSSFETLTWDYTNNKDDKAYLHYGQVQS